MRAAIHGDTPQFFCDQHRGKDDVPATIDAVFRRLTVSLSVYMAAAEIQPAHAEAEAIARLDSVIRHAGGVLDVHGVLQQVGYGGALPVALLETDRRQGPR